MERMVFGIWSTIGIEPLPGFSFRFVVSDDASRTRSYLYRVTARIKTRPCQIKTPPYSCVATSPLHTLPLSLKLDCPSQPWIPTPQPARNSLASSRAFLPPLLPSRPTLLNKLAYHPAMALNLQQTYMTPAASKNNVYLMWDFVGRTLVSIIASRARQLQTQKRKFVG